MSRSVGFRILKFSLGDSRPAYSQRVLIVFSRRFFGDNDQTLYPGNQVQSDRTSVSGISHIENRETRSRLRRKAEWLNKDRHTALERAALFCEQWRLRAFYFNIPNVTDLISECGRLRSIQGMHAAQDVVDRLRVEQRRLAQNGESFYIGRRVWQTYIYGWACLARQFPEVSQTQIKGALELMEADAVKEAQLYGKTTARAFEKSKSCNENQRLRDPWIPPNAPTIEVYNTALQGYANASKNSNSAPIEAYKLLMYMNELQANSQWLYTKPNTRSYTLVLSAFAASGHNGYGGRALGVLRRMKRAQRQDELRYEAETGRPYQYCSPGENKRDIVNADVVAHTITLNAMVRSNEDPRLIMKLLLEMQGQGGLMRSMDPILLSSALRVYRQKMKLSISDFERDRLLQEVDRILQSFQTSSNASRVRILYNTVLDIWSMSKHPNSPERCENILVEMRNSGIEPDVVSLNCCLHSWKNAARYHEDAWQRAVTLLSAFDDEGYTPDAQSYAIAILILAEPNRNENRFKMSRQLLERYVSSYQSCQFKNLASPFTAVLIVCSTGHTFYATKRLEKTSDSSFLEAEYNEDPLQIATQTYTDLQCDTFDIDVRADHHAYCAYLKCLQRFCGKDSTELRSKTREVFQDAKNDGQVSRIVIAALKRIPNWSQIVGVNRRTRNTRDLPRFWSRNVEKKWL